VWKSVNPLFDFFQVQFKTLDAEVAETMVSSSASMYVSSDGIFVEWEQTPAAYFLVTANESLDGTSVSAQTTFPFVFIEEGISSDTLYDVTVDAVQEDGSSSRIGTLSGVTLEEQNIKTTLSCYSPSGSNLEVLVGGNKTALHWSWNDAEYAEGITAYEVLITSTSNSSFSIKGHTDDPSTCFHLVSGLEPSQSYVVQLKAFDLSGDEKVSDISLTQTVETRSENQATESIEVFVSNDAAFFSWTRSENFFDYTLLIEADQVQLPQPVEFAVQNSTTFFIDGLRSGREYVFSLEGKNDAEGQPVGQSPSKPSGLRTTVSSLC